MSWLPMLAVNISLEAAILFAELKLHDLVRPLNLFLVKVSVP